MSEILNTPEVLVPLIETNPPVSAVTLLNRALLKLEEERHGETLDAETVKQRDDLWAADITDITGLQLRELLNHTYRGNFYFWNDPAIIRELYGELGENFSLFFETYIKGYSQHLIDKAKIDENSMQNYSPQYAEHLQQQFARSRSIRPYHIGKVQKGSGEYYDKPLSFIEAIVPALTNIDKEKADIIGAQLKAILDTQYQHVVDAYSIY
ncbi:MAG: hypothetical protein UV73_C0004G0159 [Candidatus Gottesmanbacteria bacterium GW2011_GWA2_43_14]|uniref:Uncharacterized protein n=1 Tax=Candidatus Gottesmanbacteria bacterium GW2011_GWA2_43_14 TaxID=1618443 RepID=A0A0G1DKB0_9BACT|nr:MAG: hypothetical protein UV73_C0004G0159 [Candidatus Gottesmanbacteria bacterium GW2011_GWA2_43_14]